MTNNKKFLMVEIFFLVVPLILAFINASYSDLRNFQWGYDNINTISTLVIVIAILGNIYIYWKNKISVFPNKIWKNISLILIILLFLFWYLGYSLSNFGF